MATLNVAPKPIQGPCNLPMQTCNTGGFRFGCQLRRFWCITYSHNIQPGFWINFTNTPVCRWIFSTLDRALYTDCAALQAWLANPDQNPQPAEMSRSELVAAVRQCDLLPCGYVRGEDGELRAVYPDAPDSGQVARMNASNNPAQPSPPQATLAVPTVTVTPPSPAPSAMGTAMEIDPPAAIVKLPSPAPTTTEPAAEIDVPAAIVTLPSPAPTTTEPAVEIDSSAAIVMPPSLVPTAMATPIVIDLTAEPDSPEREATPDWDELTGAVKEAIALDDPSKFPEIWGLLCGGMGGPAF